MSLSLIPFFFQYIDFSDYLQVTQVLCPQLVSLFLSLLLFFFSFLVHSVYLWVRIMGKFKSMVDTPETLVEFKRVYEILEDVEVSYCFKSEVEFSRGEGRVIIPLVALVKGEVRIPMSKVLTNFLRHFKVYPD